VRERKRDKVDGVQVDVSEGDWTSLTLSRHRRQRRVFAHKRWKMAKETRFKPGERNESGRGTLG
jgi:hypothetical protein